MPVEMAWELPIGGVGRPAVGATIRNLENKGKSRHDIVDQ